MPAPILTTSLQIRDLAAELGRGPAIAVDLEADSMHCYKEKVCLLQFSTAEQTWLVDPLAKPDLSPLLPVLADPAIRKIFHAADYDIRCLRRDFGIQINGLFDTMISSQFLGEEKIGLADLLNKYYGVELDKQYQRADWAIRPLTQPMIRYAAEDTRHLHRLAHLLEEKLRAKERLDWVAEEFAILETARFQEQEGPFFLRFKGAAGLDRRQLAVLEELLQWRDREARRRDAPPYKVIGNKSLLELAKTQPRRLPELVGVEGISPRLADRYGRDLLHGIETALALPEQELPIVPRGERRVRDPQLEKGMAALKGWRQRKAAELEMDAGVLINNALLEEIVRRAPTSLAALAAIPGMKTWQKQVLGGEIIEALRSEAGYDK
ncbi:MAG: HRDC domain-containing protein [Desulfuromonadales bacterium]